MRAPVQYALDRRALVEASPSGTAARPATRLLYPSILGYDEKQLYPFAPTSARRLARRGPPAQVFVSSWNDPVYDAPFNQALREQLATIGLRMTIIELSQKDSRSEALAKILRSDLIGAYSTSTPPIRPTT